ncbi:MAG: PAS domain-containing protein [Bacteroidota bacterium]
MQAATYCTDPLKVLETVPNLYLVLSPALIILTASNAYLEATLTERSKIVGKHIFEAFPDNSNTPDRVANIHASLQQVLLTRKPHHLPITGYDIPHPTIEGTFVQRYWRPSHTPVLDAAGDIEYIIQEAVNVTEAVLAEAQLNAREARGKAALTHAQHQRAHLENFFMQVPAAIAVLDGSMMVFELVNPTFQKYFPGRTLLGLPILEALPNADTRFYWPLLQNVYHRGEASVGTKALFQLARYAGGALEDTYVDFNFQPRYNEHQQVDGVIMFAYDVTEMVVARKAAEESQRQFQLLTEAIPQLVWTSAPDGNLDYFNGQTFTYSGRNHERLKGQNWAEIIHPDDLPLLMHEWTTSLQSGQPYQVEARVLGADDIYRWFLIRALPFRNEQGEITQWFGTTTDIDDKKQLEEKLHALAEELATANEEIQANMDEMQINNEELDTANQRLSWMNADLDTFVYTASHDLRSPINRIIALNQLLEYNLDGKLDSEGHKLMQLINTSLDKLNTTILDLSKIITEHADGKGELVYFRDALTDVQADIEPLIAQSNAHLEINFEIPFIGIARKHLRSILYNLLSNALKYRDPNRHCYVIVRTLKHNNQVLLSVSDNGLGLDNHEQEKLFLAFQRMHTHVEGSGVGLYTIKRIIENHGGTITAKSQKGVGTTFTIHFKA